jgi:formate dehydrogenase subunit gamma
VTTAAPPPTQRFGVAERVVHWAVAIPLTGALISGLLLGWGERVGFQPDHFSVRRLHIITGIAAVVAPLLVASLVVAAGGGGRLRQVFAQLGGTAGGDRFGAGQQAFAGFVAAGVLLQFGSGLELWQWHWFSRSFRSGASVLHEWLAYVFAVTVAGHVYLAALHPSTRWTLPGMFTGRVRYPAPGERRRPESR